MILSYDRGDPIARIEGGADDGKIIHLYDPSKKCCDKCTTKCKERKRRCCQKCEMKVGGCGTCPKAKSGGILDLSKMDLNETRRLITEMFMESKKGGNVQHEVKIEDEGKIVPLPSRDYRQIIYVSAPSGAGKSTYCASYAKEYHRLFPKNEILVFSRLPSDKVIDAIPKVKRIEINEEMLNEPIDPNTEMKNCLVIFDDIDTIRDEALRKEVQRLRSDIMEIGRHESTYCASTSHMLLNYKESRVLINESHQVTIFTDFTSAHHMDRYLKEYAGLSPQNIEMVKNLPSRWVTVNQKGPRYLLYEKGILLLNKLQGKKVKESKKKVSFKDIHELPDEEQDREADEEASE